MGEQLPLQQWEGREHARGQNNCVCLLHQLPPHHGNGQACQDVSKACTSVARPATPPDCRIGPVKSGKEASKILRDMQQRM